MTKEKKKIKLKITKVTKRIAETKNIGNYESLRVENELEAEVQEGQTGAEIQEALLRACIDLNKRDFDKLLA